MQKRQLFARSAGSPGKAPPGATSQTEDCAAEDPERGTAGDAEELKADSGLAGLSTGQLYLVAVAALWGSYAPALRFLYSLNGPPSPEVLTAVRAVLQALSLVLVALVSSGNVVGDKSQRPDKDTAKEDGSGRRSSNGQQTWWLRDWLSSTTPNVAIAGAELGLWNFLATSCQALGLEHTSATRASFLIQVTSLVTPTLSSLAGERPGRLVWLGCAVAMAGTVLLTLDHAPQAASTGLQQVAFGGDACVLAAAFFYSLATVRLSRLAPSVPSLPLATAKSLALAGVSLIWLGASALNNMRTPQGPALLWRGYREPAAWIALVWSALGPGALAAYLQTQGQSKVPAPQAQIIFSSLPLWSAFFAAVLMQGDSMGPSGWAGGLLIIAAGLIASRKS
ncbi:g1154 [Coccomyxa viridis]|uniref:G1154 protein n=1 Tax=Coccomyxa viridis TaxID=1274662 RepID=A0ABP1FHC6_9CHLO